MASEIAGLGTPTEHATVDSFLTSGTRPAFGIPKPIVTVGLTTSPLSITTVLESVKDPGAGAVVFFAGSSPHVLNSLPMGILANI